MKLMNKIRQTVSVGSRVFTADVRHVSLKEGVMKGKVRYVTQDKTVRDVPVRCVNGHRVWVPIK